MRSCYLREGDRMQARVAIGIEGGAAVAGFRFSTQESGDLFNLILSREVDVLIADAAAPKIRQRLPAWYREASTRRPS